MQSSRPPSKAYKTQIQNIIRQEARAFARNDSRQFVDADKVIAAGSELEIGLNNAQQIDEDNKTMCGADLSIRVPADILNAAEDNSPFDLQRNDFSRNTGTKADRQQFEICRQYAFNFRTLYA